HAMRKGIPAALTVLLAGHGLAFAQQSGSCPDPVRREPLPPPAATSSAPGEEILRPGDLPDPALAPGDGDARAESFGFWGSGEYPLWWIKGGRAPPLVTAGGTGVPGAPGTRILVDSLDFVDDFRPGGRFALGYRLETVPSLGVEADYFFLSDRQSDERFSSSGDPVLGRPYLDAVTGRAAATLISAPGVASGTVALRARTSLWGAE